MRRRKFCKCGCGRSLAAKRRGALWASEGCRKAFERGIAPANADKARTRHRSGPQLSRHKAYVSFASTLQSIGIPFFEAAELADQAIWRALPARQRNLLSEQRSKEAAK